MATLLPSMTMCLRGDECDEQEVQDSSELLPDSGLCERITLSGDSATDESAPLVVAGPSSDASRINSASNSFCAGLAPNLFSALRTCVCV